MLISTENTEDFWAKLLSLPSWERGLKHYVWTFFTDPESVAPLVGAWFYMAVFWLLNFRSGKRRSPRGSVD